MLIPYCCYNYHGESRGLGREAVTYRAEGGRGIRFAPMCTLPNYARGLLGCLRALFRALYFLSVSKPVAFDSVLLKQLSRDKINI